ncbi:MAG: hypothetical protein HZB12_02040 [Candidatus Yonathbacteria bacterium]|nr:hypothetical protein [Candidatus Yonathbacteria bacterium]
MITSKSLHHANIALIFDEKSFALPESADLMALYRGEEAKGARLVDDPVIRAKVLTLPAIQTRFTVEYPRVRIDDESGAELAQSKLAHHARHAYDAIFVKHPLTAWGINMDIYFRTQKLILLKDIFSSYFSEQALEGADLLDTGIQFTIRRKKVVEVWFIKVTAPLELAVHVNRHFKDVDFPDEKGLHDALEKCYNETDKMMEHFMYA